VVPITFPQKLGYVGKKCYQVEIRFSEITLVKFDYFKLYCIAFYVQITKLKATKLK
jgi:hypothetical protein